MGMKLPIDRAQRRNEVASGLDSSAGRVKFIFALPVGIVGVQVSKGLHGMTYGVSQGAQRWAGQLELSKLQERWLEMDGCIGARVADGGIMKTITRYSSILMASKQPNLIYLEVRSSSFKVQLSFVGSSGYALLVTQGMTLV